MEKSGDSKENTEILLKNKEVKMPPKSADDPESPPANCTLEDVDLQEMQAVNDELDELSSALDFFEQRTDNIIQQLKELLHSNREIREQLAMENAISPLNSDEAS